ncbi:MAG: hypothetical protein M0R03_11080 [Novosphingobium sp.]|nr:hypothetical protein [Novosphingobium sp.]
MTVTTSQTIEIRLTLDEKELDMLRTICQNPEEHDPQDIRNFKKELFLALPARKYREFDKKRDLRGENPHDELS